MLDRFPHSGKGFFPHHRDMVRFGPGEGTQGQQVIQDSWGSLHAAELCAVMALPGTLSAGNGDLGSTGRQRRPCFSYLR